MEGNSFSGDKASKCSILKNCQYCTKDGSACLQCNNNYFYFNNECLESCPDNMKQLRENGLCVNKCNVNNCENCESIEKCSKCEKGYFLYENICVEQCPIGLFGNRIDFSCVKENSKPYYWVYPSLTSCKNSCESVSDECR